MIDPYTIKDVDPSIDHKAFAEICKMHQVCFPNDKMYLPHVGYWWIVYHEDEPVAFAGLSRVKEVGRLSKTYGYLCRAGVLRKHRGKGLQKRLIAVRVAKGIALKMKMLCTSTYENPASSNNLIAAGFRMYSPNHKWGADGTSYWRLNLTEV